MQNYVSTSDIEKCDVFYMNKFNCAVTYRHHIVACHQHFNINNSIAVIKKKCIMFTRTAYTLNVI